MPRKVYTPEHKAFFAEHVKGRTNEELAEMFQERFNIETTASMVKSLKANFKLKSGLPKNKPTKTTLERKAFIEAHVKGRTNEELTKLFNEHFGLNFTSDQVKAFKNRFHLSSGLTGHFEKGSVPINKGKKKWWKGGEETQFRKGQKPWNYMPVGTERVNTDGYVDIKIAEPNVWKAKHVIIWKEANGPVPKGYKLLFGDGNKLNVTLDNLLLISQRQLSELNRHHLIQNDIELTKTGLIVANIYSKISEHKKRNKERRQENG